MITFDVALPNKYLTKKNCDIPVGHFRLSCHFLSKDDYASGAVKLVKTLVSQSTSITTTVAAGNAPALVLTTQATTAIAGATHRFTVTNSAVGATDGVIPSILNYAGTTGNPVVTLDAKSAGTFDVIITNVDTTDPLNGVLTLFFVVL